MTLAQWNIVKLMHTMILFLISNASNYSEQLGSMANELNKMIELEDKFPSNKI